MGLAIDSPYLRTHEAAAYLRFDSKSGREKIERLARSGRIKFYRIGRAYLFKKEQLDDFVEMEATRK